MHGEELPVRIGSRHFETLQIHTIVTAAVTLRLLAASPINEDSPHRFGGGRSGPTSTTSAFRLRALVAFAVKAHAHRAGFHVATADDQSRDPTAGWTRNGSALAIFALNGVALKFASTRTVFGVKRQPRRILSIVSNTTQLEGIPVGFFAEEMTRAFLVFHRSGASGGPGFAERRRGDV